jgi:hypothetical protein
MSRVLLKGTRGVWGDCDFHPDGLDLKIRCPRPVENDSKHDQEPSTTLDATVASDSEPPDVKPAEDRPEVKRKRSRFDLHSLGFPVHPVHLAASVSLALSGSGANNCAWLGGDESGRDCRLSFYGNSRAGDGRGPLAFLTVQQVTAVRPLATFPLGRLELLQLYVSVSRLAAELPADAFGSLLVLHEDGRMSLRCGGGPGVRLDEERRCELREALTRMACGVKVRFFRPGVSVFVDEEGTRWMVAARVRTQLEDSDIHRLLVHLGA